MRWEISGSAHCFSSQLIWPEVDLLFLFQIQNWHHSNTPTGAIPWLPMLNFDQAPLPVSSSTSSSTSRFFTLVTNWLHLTYYNSLCPLSSQISMWECFRMRMLWPGQITMGSWQWVSHLEPYGRIWSLFWPARTEFLFWCLMGELWLSF